MFFIKLDVVTSSCVKSIHTSCRVTTIYMSQSVFSSWSNEAFYLWVFLIGPYDFGGVLTNTNRDVVNGETVQKRNQAQKEMHWWETNSSCLMSSNVQLTFLGKAKVQISNYNCVHNLRNYSYIFYPSKLTMSLLGYKWSFLTLNNAYNVAAFILETCSLSPGSHYLSLWILQTAQPTRYLNTCISLKKNICIMWSL